MSVKQKFIDLVLRGRDLFSKDANSASQSLKALQVESKKAADEFKQLERSQSAISKARGLELYAEQAEKALQGAREEVSRLAREIDATDKPTREQAEALKLAGRSANQLQNEYNKLAGQLSRSKTDLREAGVNTDRLADEQNRLQKEIQESAAGLSEKRAKLRELSSELQKTETRTNAFAGKLSGLTSRILAFGAAYVGLNQVRSALTGIFTAGDKFEKLDIQLAGVMGSIAAGEQASAWIKDFAKNTPLQLDQVTETFVRLKNFGLDPMDGIMQSIIDQSEKLGGGYERVQGISLALGQAWAKQKLQGEEILQLIERGVPVWQLLENVTGKNTAQLQKLSEAGKLGRDVMKQLIDEIGRSAEGQAQKGMGTLSGLISNAKDNLDQFYNLIANSGALDFLKEQLRTINANFAEMSQNGELQKLAKSISDSIVSAAQSVKTFVTTLYEWRSAIGTVAAVWATLKVGTFFKDLVVGSAQALSSLASLITTKKLAATTNAFYAASFAPVLSRLAAVRAATTAWMASLTGTAAMLSKAGIFGGIAYGIYEIGRLATAWWDLRAAQKALQQSQAEASITNAVTLAELEKINTQLGTNYATTKELFAAQDAGQISLNNLTGAWQINSAEIEKNKRTLADYQQVWGTTAEGIKSAYETLGVTSTAALKETAANAEQAYKTIELGNEPIEQQRAAFMKWAEAALAAAKATGEAVPEQVKARAATLGLSSAFDDLAKKQGLSLSLYSEQSRSSATLRTEIDKTRASIDFYKRTIESSTASIEEKRLATLRLYEAEQLLKGQAEALLQVEQLKTKNYFEVQRALEAAQQQAERITQAYIAGTITTEQYNNQLQRQITLIMILQGLMPDVNDDTEQNGDTQERTGQQIDRTTQSVKEQSSELQNLSGDTKTAAKYTSLLAGAQEWLRKEFDLTEKSSESLRDRYDELTGYIIQNHRAHNEWWRELAMASNAAFKREQKIISETLKIREYTAALESSGVTMEQIRRISMTLYSGFTELGDNDLAPLRNAIADAERRILSFREGLQGTVSGLQDELDRLNDNQAAIEKRRYEQQVAELKAKLAEAQNTGDQEAIKSAQKALDLAKQINSIKTEQFAAERQAANDSNIQQEKTPAAPKPRPASQSPVLPESRVVSVSQQQATNTFRVELALPSGRVIPTYAQQSDASALMAELEQIRSTSL